MSDLPIPSYVQEIQAQEKLINVLWDLYYVEVKGHMPRVRLVEILEENEDLMKANRHRYDRHPEEKRNGND